MIGRPRHGDHVVGAAFLGKDLRGFRLRSGPGCGGEGGGELRGVESGQIDVVGAVGRRMLDDVMLNAGLRQARDSGGVDSLRGHGDGLN